MENLLEYVIGTLLGYDYCVSPRQMSEYTKRYQWIVTFDDRIRLVFDAKDIVVLRYMVDLSNDDEDAERITKLLTYLV